MTNQLSNPSAETDLTGYQSTSSTMVRRNPSGGATAPDGAWVLEGTYTSGVNMLVNTDNMTVAANPGETWSAGLYVRSTGGTARVCRADIQWLDGANAVLSTVNGTTGQVTASGTFQQAKNEGAVAPASTARVRIRMTYVGAVVGDVAELDAWQLEQGATLPAYNPVTGGGVTDLEAVLLESGTGAVLLEDGTPVLVE